MPTLLSILEFSILKHSVFPSLRSVPASLDTIPVPYQCHTSANMEQEGPRIKFNKEFSEFIKDIDLSETFMQLLERHPCAYMLPDIKNFDTDSERKIRIFSEFTREREHCNVLANMLQQSGQVCAADQLRTFNKSETVIDYTDEVELSVTPAITLRSGTTRCYTMDSTPRGMALIFITVDELMKEGKRFECIFNQLHFNVTIHANKTCQQISEILDEAVDAEHNDTFIMMFMGHGFDEKIQGWGRHEGDDMFIRDIVDKFSEPNCAELRGKPKVFIFNCCREIKSENTLPGIYKDKKLVIDFSSIDKSWTNKNKRTFVTYACAEGLKSWYDENSGYTYFGRALSHTMAQFACYKSLIELLQKTMFRMEEENKSEGKTEEHNPEIKMFACQKDLFFNPGLPKT